MDWDAANMHETHSNTLKYNRMKKTRFVFGCNVALAEQLVSHEHKQDRD